LKLDLLPCALKKNKCEQTLSAPLSILAAEVTDSKLILIPFTFALRRASEHVDLRYHHRQWLDFFEHFMNIIKQEITSL